VTAAALQVYQRAALRGLGGKSDSSIVEIWNEKMDRIERIERK